MQANAFVPLTDNTLELGDHGAAWTETYAHATDVLPRAFSALPTCVEGTQVAINNSNTTTWGATITGTGSYHVLAYCDGTNWTVAAQ
jgi:hypothetical protein